MFLYTKFDPRRGQFIYIVEFLNTSPSYALFVFTASFSAPPLLSFIFTHFGIQMHVPTIPNAKKIQRKAFQIYKMGIGCCTYMQRNKNATRTTPDATNATTSNKCSYIHTTNIQLNTLKMQLGISKMQLNISKMQQHTTT